MSNEHTAGDNEYDVTFDRAFASSCTVTDRQTGATRKLYEQDRTKPVDVRASGHPKKHRIVLKGKNGKKRDITITIDDPDHVIHGLTLDLYKEGRDPTVSGGSEPTETFTVTNDSVTCPPVCDS